MKEPRLQEAKSQWSWQSATIQSQIVGLKELSFKYNVFYFIN